MKKYKNTFANYICEAIQYDVINFGEIKNIINKELNVPITMIQPNMEVCDLEYPDYISVIHPTDWIIKTNGWWGVTNNEIMERNFIEL